MKYYFFPSGKHLLPIGKVTYGPGSVVELDEAAAEKIVTGLNANGQVAMPGLEVEENGKKVRLPCLLPAPADAQVRAVPVVVDKPILRQLPKPEEIGKVANPQPPGHILAVPEEAAPSPADGEILKDAAPVRPRATRSKAAAEG